MIFDMHKQSAYKPLIFIELHYLHLSTRPVYTRSMNPNYIFACSFENLFYAMLINEVPDVHTAVLRHTSKLISEDTLD